ncbi:MAG: hypothetical protein ABIE74_01540 [Pseudomonadota bacterium]
MINRSIQEWIVIIIVIAFAIILSASVFYERSRIKREATLITELSTLRKAIATYYLEEKKFPQSSESLLEKRGGVSYENRLPDMLNTIPKNDEGHFIDSFGRPYSYNGANGWINSSSPGVQGW